MTLCAEDDVLFSGLTVRLYRDIGNEATGACEELQCLLGKDFPAEVFLQRPALFQALLALVQGPKGHAVDVVAIATLTSIGHGLARSVQAYKDANMCPAWRFHHDAPDARNNLAQTPTVLAPQSV